MTFHKQLHPLGTSAPFALKSSFVLSCWQLVSCRSLELSIAGYFWLSVRFLEAARPEAGSTGSMGSKPLFGGGGEKQLFFIGFVLTLDPSKAYGSYSKLQPERTVLLLKSFSNEKTF